MPAPHPASGRIARATRGDAQAISDLRLAAYSGAAEFNVRDPTTIEWGAADEDNIVLAVWNAQGTALSTTRGDLLVEEAEAEAWMECGLDGIPIRFPTMLLGKGATRKDHERQGLHSALRYCFLEAGWRGGVRSLTGIVYENAPRTRLMQRIGYELYEPSTYWYTDLAAHRRTLIGVLPHTEFAAALASLRETVAPLLTQYPCQLDDLARLIDQAAARPGRLG